METNVIPQERLLAAIRTESGLPSLGWARPPKPLTGGFWAEMWIVRLTENDIHLDGDMVARVMPNAEIAARETSVQAHLADHGYPTPKVRLAAGPGTELDQAWMIMDLAPGRTLLAGLSGASTLLRLPQIARDVLTDSSGDTVLDWSASIIADPAYDLAFTRLLLSHPPLHAPRPLAPVLRAVGSRLGRRLIRTYNELSSTPLNPTQLDWYTNLHILRIQTEVGTWQAQDEIERHPGHPFLAIAAATRSQLDKVAKS